MKQETEIAAEGEVKPERACAWCGADISHKRRHAKWCSSLCASKADYAKHRTRRRQEQNQRKRIAAGWHPLEYRSCKHCGSVFDAAHARQIYCGGSCRSAAKRLRNLARCREKVLIYAKENRQAISEKERPRRRKRAAERALSLLIFPIEAPEG